MSTTLHKGETINITKTDRTVIHGTLGMDIVIDDKGIPSPNLYSIPIIKEDIGIGAEISVRDIRYITKSMPVKQDMVNHPNHYKTKSGIEAIEVIEAFTEGLTGYEAVETGNILKYICRWKKKNGLEDLKKAQWYLNRLITKVSADSIKRENDEK